MDHRHQRGRAVDHGGVDHLALARAGGLEQRGHHAEGQQHAAAAEVAHQVQRRHRRRVGPAERPQRAADGDVVDVVSGHRGHGPVLAPARHAAVDQPAVAGEAGLGPDPQPLGHSGPEPLDQPVGLLDQVEDELDGVGVLEVDARPRAVTGSAGPSTAPAPDARAPSPRSTAPGAARSRRRTWAPASASIMQVKGAGPDPRQLDDLDPAQRSTAVGHRRIVTRACAGGQAGPAWAKLGRCRRPAPPDE